MKNNYSVLIIGFSVLIVMILVAGCTNTGTQTKPTPTPIVTSPSCEMSLDAPKEVVEESRLKLCDSAGVCETGPSIHHTIKPEYFETENNPYYDNAYYNLGLLYWGQKRYEEAKDSWRKTLEINPNFQLPPEILQLLQNK